MDFLVIARREIEAGIPVIPIKAGQKQPPLVSGGTTSASIDLEQIRKWAEQFPDANVGVVCRLDGILIVDDDEGIVEKSGIPVRTRVVESSPGHRQYYFRQTEDAPIQEMPAGLLSYLQKANTAAKNSLAGNLEVLNGRKLGEGEGRNDDMTRLAGFMWDGQLDEEEFVEKLTWACELRHDPPYPEGRVRELVRRVMDGKWKPCSGFDLANLLPDGPEHHGFWIGLTSYLSRDAFDAAVSRRPKALTLKQLDAQIQAARSLEELVQGMLPVRAVNIIGGDSGLGKSPLLCQLAVCVAAGIPFLGHEVKKSRVLIADYENDAALSGMIHSVATAVGAAENALEDSLFILQRPEQRDLLSEVVKIGARLVIVDSLRGFDSQAESSKSGRGSQMIAELQALDCCWLLIHHLRKPPANAETPKAALDDDSIPVLTWLESLAGSRSLVNQTFTRIGIDRTSRKSADLVVRGYFKGRGEFGPLYLERKYDEAGEPIGFVKLAGAGMLSLNQRADLQKVLSIGISHSFGELANLLGKSGASRMLGACRAAGLVREIGRKGQKDRRYEFQMPDEVGNQ